MMVWRAYNTETQHFVGWFGTYRTEASLVKQLRNYKAPEHIVARQVMA